MAPALLHQFFEKQASSSPGAPAVHEPQGEGFDDRSLSYGEVNGAANRLARRIHIDGAGPGRCVGLLLPRVRGAPGEIDSLSRNASPFN